MNFVLFKISSVEIKCPKFLLNKRCVIVHVMNSKRIVLLCIVSINYSDYIYIDAMSINIDVPKPLNPAPTTAPSTYIYEGSLVPQAIQDILLVKHLDRLPFPRTNMRLERPPRILNLLC